MPWAYLNKGPADTVRNVALLDDIYRKVQGVRGRGTLTVGNGIL